VQTLTACFAYLCFKLVHAALQVCDAAGSGGMRHLLLRLLLLLLLGKGGAGCRTATPAGCIRPQWQSGMLLLPAALHLHGVKHWGQPQADSRRPFNLVTFLRCRRIRQGAARHVSLETVWCFGT